jgi:NAD(P)-dependent dehydrogenase (short-subunit alcohol dehydrogenase family)
MRVAVVTGASSGIGAALCLELRARGWHVVGISRSVPSAPDDYELCDVADREAVEATAARILERHPQLDLLVNNAGVAARGRFLDTEPAKIEETIRTNYLGSVWCVRALLPGLGPLSQVVNIVSVAGTFADGPYSASKHAQLAFSRTISVELGKRGIGVLGVLPGFVETPGFPQQERFKFGLSRLVASPEFVAGRILEALEAGKHEIIVPRWYRPFSWAQALVPGFLVSLRLRVDR